MIALTKIKTKNELIGEVIGLLQAPIQRVLGALQNKDAAAQPVAEVAVEQAAPVASVAEVAPEAVAPVAEAPVVEVAPAAPEAEAPAAE